MAYLGRRDDLLGPHELGEAAARFEDLLTSNNENIHPLRRIYRRRETYSGLAAVAILQDGYGRFGWRLCTQIPEVVHEAGSLPKKDREQNWRFGTENVVYSALESLRAWGVVTFHTADDIPPVVLNEDSADPRIARARDYYLRDNGGNWNGLAVPGSPTPGLGLPIEREHWIDATFGSVPLDTEHVK